MLVQPQADQTVVPVHFQVSVESHQSQPIPVDADSQRVVVVTRHFLDCGSLAKYDQNYDIRDRARFLRHLVFPSGDNGRLAKCAKKIFLAPKPAPVIESVFKGTHCARLHIRPAIGSAECANRAPHLGFNRGQRSRRSRRSRLLEGVRSRSVFRATRSKRGSFPFGHKRGRVDQEKKLVDRVGQSGGVYPKVRIGSVSFGEGSGQPR